MTMEKMSNADSEVAILSDLALSAYTVQNITTHLQYAPNVVDLAPRDLLREIESCSLLVNQSDQGTHDPYLNQ